MKKTLLLPSYNDIQKLDGFIDKIPNDIEIIIYEKKNELTDDSQDRIPTPQLISTNRNISHYYIPFIGEQHYALILYIINNYNDLQGILHFSKTHWLQIFSNINCFTEELKKEDVLYCEHQTFRKFVYIFPDIQIMGHKHAILDLLTKHNIHVGIQHIVSYNRECTECNRYDKCYNCSMFFVNKYELQNILFTTSYLREKDNCMKKMKEIFLDYQYPTTEFDPIFNDTSYMIHSKIILYHSIDVYKNILYDLQNNVLTCHDEVGNFIHLFFNETMKRMKKA